MKRSCVICLFLCVTATFLLSQSNPVPAVKVPATRKTAAVVPPVSVPQPGPQAQSRILDGYGKLPLSFEPNLGQADAQVKFLSRTGAYTLFLTGDEAVLTLRGKKPRTNSAWELKPASFAGSSPAARTAPFAKTHPGGSSGDNEAVAETLNAGALRMKLRNANPSAKVTGEDELAGSSNYFLGNDPAKWRTNVATYAKVKYQGIYPGIDLVYYGNQRQLEYDFIVAPGADPHRIAFDLRGAKKIRQNARGDLVLNLAEGEMRWHKPVAYQKKNGTRQLVGARYAITDNNRVSFELAKYDAAQPLYIDPLIYSTYLGGSMVDYGHGIAVDSAGNAYIIGQTSSTDFPTMNQIQPSNAGGRDAFVVKLNPTGTALVYSTYLGGSGGELGGLDSADIQAGIAVDSAGNAYVSGLTWSADFPTTPGAFQTVCSGVNGCVAAFVAKLNSSGSSLVYSTFLGGSSGNTSTGIAVDRAGHAYVTGGTSSIDFPTTPGAFQTTCSSNCEQNGDVFVTKFNSTGSALVYSTYLGGSDRDTAAGIALDSSGNAYVTGNTYSTDFPTRNPVQATNGGGPSFCPCDAFVTKLNSSGTALVYSTYLGGNSFDIGHAIAVDPAGDAYVVGETGSADFPTTPGAFQTVDNSVYPVGEASFVAKLSPSGSALSYSTYLAGRDSNTAAFGVAVDSSGSAYVTGLAGMKTFPTKHPLPLPLAGGLRAFVSRFTPSGSALVYSTLLGGSTDDNGYGIAVDSMGSAYVTGATGSTDFPVTPGAFQTTCNGSNVSQCAAYGDAFVSKILYFPTTTQLVSSMNPSVSGKLVTFTATVSSSSGGTPTSKVTFLNGATVLGSNPLNGGTARFATAKLPLGSSSITAVYGGDANYAGSTSAPVNQFVLAATTTTLTSSLNPSTKGQPVTFTAELTSSLGAPPDGETVTFLRAGKLLGTGALSGGTASVTTSTLPVGTGGIQAVYAGDSTFGGSKSTVLKQVVN